MLHWRLEIFSTSFVSTKSQINPRTEINGIDAKIPAIIELRLAISETATTNPDVVNILMTVYIIVYKTDSRNSIF